jgi:hypothetical protein
LTDQAVFIYDFTYKLISHFNRNNTKPIQQWEDGWTGSREILCCFFFFDLGGGGENMMYLLKKRESDRSPPIQIWDGFSRNIHREFKIILAN